MKSQMAANDKTVFNSQNLYDGKGELYSDAHKCSVLHARMCAQKHKPRLDYKLDLNCQFTVSKY